MPALPTPLLEYLHAAILEPRSPAYLLVSKDGRLADWGGRLEVYGIVGLQRGRDIGEQVCFLASLLPLANTPLTLSYLKTESGRSVDVYLVPGAEGDWVLLLDATQEERQRILLQQKTNDLALLRQKQSQLWDQYRGQNVTHERAQQLFPFQHQGERRDVTILFTDIREFTAYSATHPPEEVWQTLNVYLRALLHALINAGGIVDAVKGEAVLAVFGILPSTEPPAVQALKAASQIIAAVRENNAARQKDNQPVFATSIGLASGPVVLGMVGSTQYKQLGVVGYPAHLAVYLASRARPWEIVVDDKTFHAASAMQEDFVAVTLGEAEPIRAFSYLVRGNDAEIRHG